MEPYLTTDRLVLQQFTADDADLLVELDSDPEVMRYLTGGEPTAAEEVRDQILPGLARAYERWDGRFGVFATREREGGAFVGWFLLRPERDGPLDVVELGYRLRRAAWGRGYATEGSRALIAKGFGELDVRLVWAETMTVNRASRHVMEKVGMTFAGASELPEDMQTIPGAERGGVRFEITAAPSVPAARAER